MRSCVSVDPWWSAGVVYIGILLGPERTRVSVFLSRQDIYRIWIVVIPCLFGGGWCCSEFRLCVLFENCTVDASIFVVSNEERTVDALAPGADEGRRRLR